MSVRARSLGSAGRPVFGRPVAAVVVAALIATFAVGAPAAFAEEPPGPGATAADASQTTATPPPADPPVVETPPADPPPAEPAPADPPPTDPPGGNPPTVDSPSAESPSGDSPPAGAPAGDSPPAQSPSGEQSPAANSPSADTAGEQSPPAASPNGAPPPGDAPAEQEPAQPAPPAGGNHSSAHNDSRVIQAVWQVQQGCRSHCHGTSQTQRSEQVSNTTQRATAISGESDGGGSSAQARNESSTIQFVWQMQIGCVAFCFHTSQSQEASQQSYTTQEADAQSALAAWAENLAETLQYVFQIQQGCEHECHGVSQHQSSTQGQTTNQSATADALGVGVGLLMVPDWLIAYAHNIGATIQLIYQYQEALCQEHCTGDAQLQEAIQRAVTDQNAVALAAPPEPPEPLPGEPPVGEPPPGATGPSVTPEAEPPGTPSVAATSSGRRQSPALGWKRRRTVRRQELVLRAGARSTGDGQATPGGSAAPVPSGSALGDSRPLSAAAEGSSAVSTTVETASDDDMRGIRAAANQLPVQTFTTPSAPTAGGSMGWLLVLLLTVAAAALIASLRRVLANTTTQT